MTKKKTYYTIGASFFAMLIMAITENSRGVLIPTFKAEFGVSDTTIGLFLFFVTLSFVVSTHFAAEYVKKHGQKFTIRLGMGLAGAGFLVASITTAFWQFLLVYIILTIGISYIIMSLNTMIPLLKVAYISVVMNTLHFFYGVGGTISHKTTGFLIEHDISWRSIFVAFAVLYGLGILIYSFVEQPPSTEDHHKRVKIKRFEMPLIILFGLGLGFYGTAELQTANWMVNYLEGTYEFTSNQASSYSAIFFLTLSVGRLFGGYILEKIGYVKGIIGTLALALVTYSLGLINEEMVIFISLSGVFFAIVYPTVILLVQDLFKENMARVVAIVTMMTSGVSMVLGAIIGALNDIIGVKMTYYIMPVSLFISLVFMIVISGYIKVVKQKRLEGVVE